MFEAEIPRSGFGVDNHGPRRDLLRSMERPAQGIEQEMLSQSRALKSSSDRHPPKERSWKRKTRQTFCQFGRQISARNGVRGKSVEAGDGPTIGCENKYRSGFALEVLASPFLQIEIEFRDTATETRPIVMRFERFNSQVGGQILTRHYAPVCFL